MKEVPCYMWKALFGCWLERKNHASLVRSSARYSSAWSVGFASLSLFQDGELTQAESSSRGESMLL